MSAQETTGPHAVCAAAADAERRVGELQKLARGAVEEDGVEEDANEGGRELFGGSLWQQW